jgi:hypothetical protein
MAKPKKSKKKHRIVFKAPRMRSVLEMDAMPQEGIAIDRTLAERENPRFRREKSN